MIDPTVVQNMGVRTAHVDRGDVARAVRAVGEVEAADARVSAVNLRVSGWIERLRVDQVGDVVRAGNPLFDLVSPELSAAAEELLLAAGVSADGPRVEAARARLNFLGLADTDVDGILASGKAPTAFPVRAPRAGHVVSESVTEGSHVKAGADLFVIADLSRVQVRAAVYELDAPLVTKGQAAWIELGSGEPVSASIDAVLPTLDPRTRTLTVRLEVPNPDLRLKPGMAATVNIETGKKEGVLRVPSQAVVRSGDRPFVFVSKPGGRFDPRPVRLGVVGDEGLTEVLGGLMIGEKVVTSGQFLLDSESQLRSALEQFEAPEHAE